MMLTLFWKTKKNTTSPENFFHFFESNAQTLSLIGKIMLFKTDKILQKNCWFSGKTSTQFELFFKSNSPYVGILYVSKQLSDIQLTV